MRPLRDRVLVRTEKRRDRDLRLSRGGVWLPSVKWTDGLVFGEVVAVGPKVREIEPGQRVMVGELSGTAVEKDGKAYRLVREKEIIAEAGAGVGAPDVWV